MTVLFNMFDGTAVRKAVILFLYIKYTNTGELSNGKRNLFRFFIAKRRESMHKTREPTVKAAAKSGFFHTKNLRKEKKR